ncbi:hypothetical protein V1264_009040 [Littorina saxatilis]|uniref:Uncharacterized protein n=1 Tax=Littorina saxatilis TaxID=31220 RepID=A0AAN9AQV1_9CAEN
MRLEVQQQTLCYVSSDYFERFINELHTKIPSLSLWCASVQKLNSPPSWMFERHLTTPLRCPPTVTKEVAKSKEMKKSGIPSYSSTPAPAATEGPPVKWLPHKGGQDGHTRGSAMACNVCGDAVVHLLLKELRVGQSSGSDPLQYRDVLLLAPKSKTEVKSTEGIIFKLRDNGVPVQVLTGISKVGAFRDVALALKDEITVADPMVVSGLERRVVIATGSGNDDKHSNNRLFAMSRSTSLLVWIGERPGK